jgi:formylglycine-generating enzyme required for sulfatase activity
VDDDCDGSTDETADLPPIFIGSDVGECEPAIIACVGGTTTEVDPGHDPSPETCDGRDNDCSGTADDSIPSVPCYTGPVGTEGVGICAGGDTTCAGGTLLCVGQSLPVAETCDGFDNNCDGVVDGSRDGSGNPVALAQPCYSGPSGTLDVGECIAGTTTCSSGTWGACVGEVVPDFERCEVLDGLDNDCDGATDEWQDEMVVVPEGAFTMGSPDSVGSADEHPQHTVTLSRYCMDRYEVTNAQYRACVDAGVCDPPASEDSRTRVGYFTDPTYDQYPVMNVTWFMADAYCQWAGKQLPTEAQWEKAARGTDGRTYPWGDDTPTCDLARFYDCLPRDTIAVNTLPLGASPYGALHMAGNVDEWVSDWYDESYYIVSPSTDPAGPSNGERKVYRGGGSGTSGSDINATARAHRPPDDTRENLGFRCTQ